MFFRNDLPSTTGLIRKRDAAKHTHMHIFVILKCYLLNN